MTKAIKKLNGYTALARFLASACEYGPEGLPIIGEVQSNIQDRYSYAKNHVLYAHNGRKIFWVEYAQRRYQVYEYSN